MKNLKLFTLLFCLFNILIYSNVMAIEEANYEIIEKKEHNEIKKSKKKFSETEINWIKNCVDTNNRASYKQVCGMFETVHNKKISETVIGKILKNKY